MQILDGKIVAQNIREKVQLRVERYAAIQGRAPHLTVVLVGEDEASKVYVRNKRRACEAVGMTSSLHELSGRCSQQDLEDLIYGLNTDKEVDGILVQLPLPKHLDAGRVLEILNPMKDADGLTYDSLGRFLAGKSRVSPCTPQGVMRILDYYQIPVAGKRAVVIGRSNIVGKPMSLMLNKADATVTMCHSKTVALREHTVNADLVIVAAGSPRLFSKDDFKKNAVVIDVGIHGSGQAGGICGDVDFESLRGWVAAATPVPGGVGPMTIACLLENTITLAEMNQESSC